MVHKLFIIINILLCLHGFSKQEILTQSSAYDNFLEFYHRTRSLEITDINDIIKNVFYRFGCFSNICDQCLNNARLQAAGIIGTTVEREEFKNVSIVLVCYIADLSQFCTAHSIPNVRICQQYLTNFTNNIQKSYLNDLINNHLKPKYRSMAQSTDYSRSQSNVVDGDSLFNKYSSLNTNENNLEFLSQISEDIVSSIYKNEPIGQYPNSNYFIDELFNSYSNSSIFDINSLTNLMNDIGFPQSTLSSRKKRSIMSRQSKLKITKKNSTPLSNSTNYDKCYSANDLINIFGFKNTSILKSDLQSLTSAFTYLQAKGLCLQDNTTPESFSQESRSTDAEKYGYGTIAISIVSVLALLGIILLPCFNKSIYEDILTALTALAVGTLFCDASLHIIPEILGVHAHDDESKEIEVPIEIVRICVLIAALYLFWLLEVVFHRFTGTHAHSHNHSNENEKQISSPSRQLYQNYGSTSSESQNYYPFAQMPIAYNPVVGIRGSTSPTIIKRRFCCDFKNVKATAWMLIFSDAIHNFADGLAVGASFSQSVKIGISTTIAIVCHEIPHELGNYAILVRCGLSHFQALLLNLLSACSCFIGFYVGVSISSNEEVSLWIFSVTAGMFFYISLVDLLPNLLMDGKWTWKLFIIVNICLWLGFIIMFLLVIFEDKISI